MSLESSHERTQQEQPRSATAAETDHIPAVQGDNNGEQLPANITPAPVPPGPDELVALVLSWIRTSDWSTSQAYLQAHPELLTEGAAQVLARLTQHQPDQHVHELLTLHQQLLQIAGQQGVEAAYQALRAATDQEELPAQVITWLQTPDWKTSETYLQTHPNLLTNAAEHMLEELKRVQEDEQAQAIINLHQTMLQKARVEGIEAAYKRFLVPEPEVPLSDQEVVTYQDLQDSVTLYDAGMAAHHQYWVSGQVVDLNRAVECWHEALKLTPSNSPNRPALLNNLGNGLRDRYERTGDLADLQAAISAYQQAIQATSPDSPDWSGYLNNLGNGLRDRYERTGDLADLQAAITAWETSWSVLSLHFAALPVVYKLSQQRQEGGISGNLVTAYLERAARRRPSAHADQRSALVVAEGNKSRLLTQLVGRGPLPLPTGLSPQIAEREQQLLADLTALDTQELATHGYSATAQEETSRLSRLQQRQADLSELEDLWTSIARLGPEGMEYVALRRGESQTWQDLTHLAKQVGPNTALLSFFTTPDRVLLFLLRAGWRMPRIVEAPVDQTDWINLLERFYREVHCYGPGLRRSETWDQPLRPLFAKAQPHLEGVERLILAPTGIGHLLPWSVLAERAGWHTFTGQPLPLVTLPALGILPRLRQRQHVPPGAALVVGNPRGDLPYAEGEANTVAERLGTKPLLGAAATTSAVLTRLPDATLIHLATHAFFDADNPLESGIVLADGVLTAREVLQHRLQADLLVLSACESGQVGSLGGEELAGLSQAFLQAGVRSLLVSLWQVNDPATAAFMQTFYTARQAGVDKALALRQAMTLMQQDLRWSHPYYWGAFILVGDWD